MLPAAIPPAWLALRMEELLLFVVAAGVGGLFGLRMLICLFTDRGPLAPLGPMEGSVYGSAILGLVLAYLPHVMGGLMTPGLCTDLVSGNEFTSLAIMVLVQTALCVMLGQAFASRLDTHEARYLRQNMTHIPGVALPILAMGALTGLSPIASQSGCAPTAVEPLVYPIVFLPIFGALVTLMALRQRRVHLGFARP